MQQQQQMQQLPPPPPKSPLNNRKRVSTIKQDRKEARDKNIQKRRTYKKPSPEKVDTKLNPNQKKTRVSRIKQNQKNARAKKIQTRRTYNYPLKKSDSKFARAPPPEELERKKAMKLKQINQNKKMEKQRKQREQNASPGKKPPVSKKENTKHWLFSVFSSSPPLGLKRILFGLF